MQEMVFWTTQGSDSHTNRPFLDTSPLSGACGCILLSLCQRPRNALPVSQDIKWKGSSACKNAPSWLGNLWRHSQWASQRTGDRLGEEDEAKEMSGDVWLGVLLQQSVRVLFSLIKIHKKPSIICISSPAWNDLWILNYTTRSNPQTAGFSCHPQSGFSHPTKEIHQQQSDEW